MNEINLDYFVRRMCEEKEAAAKARNPQVAAVHEELAKRYAAVSSIRRSVLREDDDPCSSKVA